MIKEHLRRYSSEERAWSQYIAYWNSQGYQFEQGIEAQGPLLHFITDSRWEGFIDLRDWYASFMPQQARMASISCTVEQLKTLFLNCTEPLVGLPPGLEYQRVESLGLVENSKTIAALFSCVLPHGRMWLNGKRPDAISPPERERTLDITRVPITLFFEIGHSFISYQLLKKIRRGDVLLVNHVENKMKVNGESLAKFVRNEEGFMFDIEDSHEYSENADFVVADESSSSAEKKGLVPVNKVKIQLGFVLQTSTVSLQELEGFYQGEILPCNLDAEKSIEITANGAVVARGELVWFDERFGVEIKELCHEVNDDPR
ncbi:FliM/FliN family flagellar motor switch protein [Kluyvera sp. NPDC087067]|uniref:FliM/FliN family flagellar motor switch protein n=1 Tax=Kluyvera sp. NPDC087067 TaxID=3364105 RepID=UPI00382ED92B